MEAACRGKCKSLIVFHNEAKTRSKCSFIPRGCEKISSLLRRFPNRAWRRCERFKVCHDWASCSSLHSPILDLVRPVTARVISGVASHIQVEETEALHVSRIALMVRGYLRSECVK
ncbi:MAG: hypothetical protein BECKG1743D_GA0114223_104831, partial [Candidatus Kentron sp. G]